MAVQGTLNCGNCMGTSVAGAFMDLPNRAALQLHSNREASTAPHPPCPALPQLLKSIPRRKKGQPREPRLLRQGARQRLKVTLGKAH